MFTARRKKFVFLTWILILAGLGSAAPSVFDDLAGAGWQANNSESVQVRELAKEHFGGNASSAIQVVIHTPEGSISDPQAQETIKQVTSTLDGDERISAIIPPQQGSSISPDGKTGILIAGANANTDDMVRAVDQHKSELTALSTPEVEVYPTGSSALWSDFNKANHDAMIKAEMMSWPITLIILIIAFGSLIAAGLPLLLTIAGLVASAGGLVLLNQFTPISVWAMNFAMMFALALGIDYALFIVARFRDALEKSETVDRAVAETLDTAGKAVVLSGFTVLISLSAVLIVPAPAVRTMAIGIMLAVTFVLAATVTLLPAALAGLGSKVNAVALPFMKNQQHRSPLFHAWASMLHKRPAIFAAAATLVLVILAIPVFSLKVAMPSISVVPEDAPVRQGYEQVQESMGVGAPGMLQIIADESSEHEVRSVAQSIDGIAMVTPAQPSTDGSKLISLNAVPEVDPSDEKMSQILTDLRTELPDNAHVGGAPAENLDLQQALNDYLPIVVGIILLLGFLLLLLSLQAPIVALLGTLVSLLSTGAAFGVAQLIFQEGHLSGLLNFNPQGFLNGWGPVFFFAMIFAIAMDYTVFLLATAKEHHEKTQSSKHAVIEGMAHSGRIIFAAAAVMVAVFFTFSLADPLPPKEMGIILGVAVLLDAFLVRLILLPALLSQVGDLAWWSPRWLKRMLPSISFSH
ncbi:MMPL family transporter [Corynebacterium dentalis]|uniref:MMPL family transporter n=1 Tax=Corynebacterium dentalis TaxID=2014528 RepID=UPI00289A160B|nr:MMPL family transporter [Corynebacterium dentalis]